MALVQIGCEKDEYGRPCPVYKDTDDLDDAEYHYYCNAKKSFTDASIKFPEYYWARQILLGSLTAEMIESDDKYASLRD